MKFRDIINESATDVVARFYKEASEKSEAQYNPENSKYKDLNKKYYDEYFKEWASNETVPVFTKPVNKAQPVYNTKPEQGKQQSPGYRGLQYSKAAAGLPYDRKVQKYELNPARMLSAQAANNLQGIGN